MTKQELWKQFETTGSVETYLAYRRAENSEEKERRTSDEDDHRRVGDK